MRFREMFKSKTYITDNSWGNSDFQIKGKMPDRIANLKDLTVIKVPGTIESTYDNYIKYENINTILEDIMPENYSSCSIKIYKIDGIVFDRDYIDTVFYFYPESKIRVPVKSDSSVRDFNPAIFVYRNKVVGVVMPIETQGTSK